ncbi:NADP-dependent 3-hydroxy acid dehydrogenase YdfG [Luteococcus japonicus]|uniref:NADP-dependent 3-hydroxy acid dehydrogenase YdfG n=1 Tax=Luteococcus japonicus TaxID=33984 RepID=A0A3N1ZSC3_9ACTN|nr:SDR family oxidoreductase [Luteococcus japonicus]ROR53766.1 NADP-dependent 3-hydroxy acid dehydrogenase YdfG [Luteococcus japonicus]
MTTSSKAHRPVALVTGANRGIGRAIAHRLADTHHVLVGGRHAAAVQALVDELPSAAPFVCDLTDEASVAAAAGAIDRLDVLVHSAGLSSHGTLAETPAEDWRRLYEMNVVAVATLTRLLLPRLREAHGQVVTINSGSGFTSKPGNGVYSASKFALRALTDALREEERGTVRVSSIHPGRVDTDMQVELQAQLGREYDPDEHLRPSSVAEAVALAVFASPEAMVEELSIRPVVK